MKNIKLKNLLSEAELKYNTSNVHPWVLHAMEELRDDLQYVLDPKNQKANSKIDFPGLKKQLKDLIKKIDQYNP